MTDEEMKDIFQNGNAFGEGKLEVMYRREAGLKHLEEIKMELRSGIDFIIRKG